jgi:saccharopine dehydrogenase-like NADP-dependent oxidoreductase
VAGRIVLLGGYGAVGRAAAQTLGRWFPQRVVIAGRDPAKAAVAAAQVGPAIEPLAVDVTDEADVRRAVAGAEVVVMCVEQSNAQVAWICLQHGVHYVDVSASDQVHESITQLDELAMTNQATAILSVGVAPGLTNLLARRCVERLGNACDVDITVLLGLGEHHGVDAVRWTLANLARPADRDGPRLRRRRVLLPGFGRRTAFPFGFSDQHTLARTLGVRATTRLCFDSAAITWALFALRSAGVFAAARRFHWDAALAAVAARIHLGGDRFVIQVEATDEHGRHARCAASGRRQSQATGLVAAHVVRLLQTGGIPPGVHHVEQLAHTAVLLSNLEENGISVLD